MSDPQHVASLEATMGHVERLRAKRATLEAAEREAVDQLATATGRVWRSGGIGVRDLAALYQRLRAGALSGFSKSWMSEVGLNNSGFYRELRRTPDADADGSWSGEYPLDQSARVPGRGVPVVYVLFDPEYVPCYVGSTGNMRVRLKAHDRDKAFVAWRAAPTSSRDEAYEIETEWLRGYKPYLNKRAAR